MRAREAPNPVRGLDADQQRYRQRYATILSSVLAVVTVGQTAGFIATGQYWLTTAIFGALAAVSVVGLVSARRGKVNFAIYLQLFALCLVALGAVSTNLRPGSHYAGAAAYFIVIVIAANMLGTRACVLMTVVSLGCTTTLILLSHFSGRPEQQVFVTQISSVYLSMLIVAVAVVRFQQRARQTERILRERIEKLDLVMVRARKVATGDLSEQTQQDSVLDQMVQGLRGIVQQARQIASQVVAASEQLAQTSTAQEHSAQSQAAAANETLRTMGLLRDGSVEIADSIRGVATTTSQAADNAAEVGDRIAQLDAAIQRITETLGQVHTIANKSEMLALNAALEATRAGEAGRGFSLVARQMQQIAETTKALVAEVATVLDQVEASRRETVVATSEGHKMFDRAHRSAEQIERIVQRQHGSTEEALFAVSEIGAESRQVATASNQALRASEDLAKLARQLEATVERFRL